jgi:hypothetical protein
LPEERCCAPGCSRQTVGVVAKVLANSRAPSGIAARPASWSRTAFELGEPAVVPVVTPATAAPESTANPAARTSALNAASGPSTAPRAVTAASGGAATPPRSATRALTVARPSPPTDCAGKSRHASSSRVQPLTSTRTTAGWVALARTKRTRNAGKMPAPAGAATARAAPGSGHLHVQSVPS